MLYMVVEKFKPGTAPAIYQRAHERGRMMPAGLEYVSSWVDLAYTACFQLMNTDDPALIDEWTSAWQDLVEFEIIPVRSSAEASKLMEQQS